jgi:hypothetical protein
VIALHSVVVYCCTEGVLDVMIALSVIGNKLTHFNADRSTHLPSFVT